MYYTHEYDSNNKFNSYEEACDSLITLMDVDEYAEHELLNVRMILLHFFLRKDDSSFIKWFQDYLDDLTVCICDELITEHDDDEDE